MVCLGLAVVAARPADGQASAVAVPRLGAPIVVDGRPDDAEWQGIAPLPLTALYPAFGVPLTERTEIRVAYNSRAVYASIRAWDSEPGRIMANTLYRDRWSGDDEFAVILDTFNDRENAVMFLVTPAGVRIDNQISNDAEPGRGSFLNQDWNAVWDARAVVTDSGWTAELRVPFTSLRYRLDGDSVVMRLKAFRYLPRKGENQMYPPTRPSDGPTPHFQPSLGQVVVMHGVPATRPLLAMPYTRAAAGQREGIGKRDAAMGLDLKVAPLPSLAVDLTVNTDFAQVEADDEQVNFTRFSLFFPEKRPFFQERSGLFGVSTGGSSAVFYSRRVGLSPGGAPLPILGGVRLAGTAGSWEVGALGMYVGRDETDGGGGELLQVIRGRRGVGSGVLGVMLTDRRIGDASSSTVAMDAVLRLGKAVRATLVLAQTYDSSATSPSARNSRLLAQVQRRSAGGASWSAEYRGAGAEYDPAMGFVQARGFHEGVGSLGYSWRPGAGQALREHTLQANLAGRHRTRDGRPDELSAALFWGFETSGNVAGSIRMTAAHEHVPASFALNESIRVGPGSYTTGVLRLTGTTPYHLRLRMFGALEGGGVFGGRRLSATLEPTWAQSRHLELGVVASLTALAFDSVARRTDHLVRARVRIALTARFFVETYQQFNSFRDAASTNVRVRWNLSEGHDLWLAGDWAREHGDGTERLRQHEVTVKYTRLFTLDLSRGAQ